MESGTRQNNQSEGTPDSDRDEVHRVLLVADEIFQPDDLAQELRSHFSGSEDDVDIYVVAPAIAHSAIDQELGNIDKTRPEAEDRLNEIVAGLQEEGFRAAGSIGDSDPLVAVGDGLTLYPADEIVVVMHTADELEQAEKGLSERLKTDFHQPVTQLKVRHPDGDGSAPEVDSVDNSPAHEVTGEEYIQENRNFPPLKKRDTAGILIGVLGTIGLGLIAVAAGTKDDGELSGSAAIILLIAIAAFLVNVAHVVGLLFFESVRYTGIWERFMARTSMFFTGIGLVVALILWLTI